MRRNTIGAVWVGGLLFALVLYAAGPEHFITAVFDLAARLPDALGALIANLGAQMFDVVRSLAIALFVIFLALGVLAARRGLPARAALLVVSTLFLVLVWRPPGEFGPPGSNWMGAFVLAAVGAGVMTRRLLANQPGTARRIDRRGPE